MRQRAFTLIELLVVVAIIAILAAIALPNFLEAQTRAKVTRARADMRSVATALETYRVDFNIYPPAIIGEYPAIPIGQFNYNLYHLSTPISYLTSLPNDVFNGGHHPAENPWSAPGKRNNTFDYNTFQRDVLETSADPMRWYEHFGNSAWKMVSAGPDLDFVNDTSEFGYGDRYDATNGTISGGDLVRSQAVTE